MDHNNSKHAARDFKCNVCDYISETPFEMYEHKVSVHKAFEEIRWETIVNMQEIFLTGLASQVDNLMEAIVSTMDEVLGQLSEMKAKNEALEIEMEKARIELFDFKKALTKSNIFSANMQHDSEVMLNNIVEKCETLKDTADKITTNKEDLEDNAKDQIREIKRKMQFY